MENQDITKYLQMRCLIELARPKGTVISAWAFFFMVIGTAAVNLLLASKGVANSELIMQLDGIAFSLSILGFFACIISIYDKNRTRNKEIKLLDYLWQLNKSFEGDATLKEYFPQKR